MFTSVPASCSSFQHLDGCLRVGCTATAEDAPAAERRHDRSLVVGLVQLRVGAVRQQQLDQIDIVLGSRRHQRSRPAGSAAGGAPGRTIEQLHVGVRALVQQQRDDILGACLVRRVERIDAGASAKNRGRARRAV